MEHTYSQASRPEKVTQVFSDILVFFLEIADEFLFPVVAYSSVELQLLPHSVFFLLALFVIVHVV